MYIVLFLIVQSLRYPPLMFPQTSLATAFKSRTTVKTIHSAVCEVSCVIKTSVCKLLVV